MATHCFSALYRSISRRQLTLDKFKYYGIYNHMVIYQTAELDLIFGALANATRRSILNILSSADQTVLELVDRFEMSQPAITKHLKILERAGLIQKRKEGRYRFCRFQPEALEAAADWADKCRKHWEESFTALDQYLERLNRKEEV
jgi:DNA-binding transcriptional ArsR family regulator